MRLISKFSDYYDSCLALGYDDDRVVYLRQTSEYPLKATWSPKGWVQPDTPAIIKEVVSRIKALITSDRGDWDWRYNKSVIIPDFKDKENDYNVDRFGVLFCGKCFPGIRVAVTKRTPGIPSSPFKTEWFYDADDLIAFMESRGVTTNVKMGRGSATIATNIRDYFSEKAADVDWQIENKITCIVYEPYNDRVLINPPLKDYGFYKAIDHYTAFQELDQWLGGTLAWPFNMTVEISDTSKVAKHGFDPKYGFRTRPSGD